MNKFLKLVFLFFAISASSGFAQTGSVAGVVTDSLSGKPIIAFSVFIPSTTFGTATNQKGAYLLDKLNPGDYTIEFRHLSYPTITRKVSVQAGIQITVNLVVAEQSTKLKEFVIVGKVPDRRVGFQLFREYFLGDRGGTVCTVKNPDDISYFYEGDIIKATAKKPLIIENRYLGYRLTYYLDYFKYVEDKNPDANNTIGAYFGYSGSALFQDLSEVIPLNALFFKMNRAGVFKGSLRHFLASLYANELPANHYYVRKAYHGFKDLQHMEKLSAAMTKIGMASMDSLFSWDPVSGQTEFLYYDPNEEFRFNDNLVKGGPKEGEKTLATDSFLLVFSDYQKTPDLRDDWISSLRLSPDGMTFDKEGNYWVPNGNFSWTNLHNTIKIKSMLPYDYMPKILMTK
jgi:hypothetical protein